MPQASVPDVPAAGSPATAAADATPRGAEVAAVEAPAEVADLALDSVGRSGVYPLAVSVRQPVEKLTISRLARLGGVNLETIRYYERQGLLAKPPRTAAGYRVFPSETARRLRFIKRTQELGFSLREIRDLLSLRMRPGTGRAQILARAHAKITDVDQKIRSLQAIKKTLRSLTDRCDGCGPVAACPILESLDHEDADAEALE